MPDTTKMNQDFKIAIRFENEIAEERNVKTKKSKRGSHSRGYK